MRLIMALDFHRVTIDEDPSALNAALTPITWMLAGAVLGYAEALRASRKSGKAAAAVVPSVVIGNLPEATMRRTEM